MKKLLAFLLAVVMVMSFAACGSDKPAETTAPKTPETTVPETTVPETTAAPQFDWTGYTDWLTDDWDSKTVSYQFTGEWALPEYGMNFSFLINLYDDGSVAVDQRNVSSGSSYMQFGYWSEQKTEDGNEISLDTLYCTGLQEGELIAHEYHYDLYEESDGGYSFGYTFGIAPGAYFRTADVVGSNTVTHATMAEFHTAVDVIVETYRFINSAENDYGFSAVISILSNNTATADMQTVYEGNLVTAYQETGNLMITADENNNVSYVLVLNEVEIPLTVNEDGTIADFTWKASWATMNITIEFPMTATDVVVETPAE